MRSVSSALISRKIRLLGDGRKKRRVFRAIRAISQSITIETVMKWGPRFLTVFEISSSHIGSALGFKLPKLLVQMDGFSVLSTKREADREINGRIGRTGDSCCGDVSILGETTTQQFDARREAERWER